MGTHQQLLAQRGIYYKLYQLQYKDQEIPVGSDPQVTASATTSWSCGDSRPRLSWPSISSTALCRQSISKADINHFAAPKQLSTLRVDRTAEGGYPHAVRYNVLRANSDLRRGSFRRNVRRAADRGSAALAGESPATTLNPTARILRGGRRSHAGCGLRHRGRRQRSRCRRHLRNSQPSAQNLGLFHKLIAEADRRKPDLAIVIDSPAFNWRVARQMHKRGIPVVYYVCPQFWAWRQGRVRLLRKYVDKALVIFPFEEKFYRDRGVDATFVGHPLADLPRPGSIAQPMPASTSWIPPNHWITLMPGSRVKEVRMNLPAILESARQAGPELRIPASGRAHAGSQLLETAHWRLPRSIWFRKPCPRWLIRAPASSPAARPPSRPP